MGERERHAKRKGSRIIAGGGKEEALNAGAGVAGALPWGTKAVGLLW